MLSSPLAAVPEFHSHLNVRPQLAAAVQHVLPVGIARLEGQVELEHDQAQPPCGPHRLNGLMKQRPQRVFGSVGQLAVGYVLGGSLR